MPTGYTSDIYEGKDVNYKEFILQCARAFGACITLKEEPLSSEIPEFKPSTYHKEQLEKAKKRLKEIQNITIEQAEQETEKTYQSIVENNKKCYQEVIEKKNRYLNVLADVCAWQPPTKEHEKLKEFAKSQLEESLNFDCGNIDYYKKEIKKETAEEWIQRQIDMCLKDIEYHSKHWKTEVEVTNKRNQWIKQLKESLEEN